MKRILIIADRELVLDGVKKILDAEPGAVTFEEATTDSKALLLVREQEWDLAVLDLALGGPVGLGVLKELKQIRPRFPVLMLSRHSHEQFARRALQAGAAGYVTEDSPRTELLKAVNAVLEGRRYVSFPLNEMLGAGLEKSADRPLHEALSDREFEVLCGIGLGKTVSEIAKALSLSDKTVSTYRARVLKKMAMKNNAELMHYVVQNKLAD